jgi:predicted TIM-barrel fold metal-dependent hydrolase
MLRAMDRAGVDRSMLLPFPVVEDARSQHDEIGRAVRDHPDRFAGAACLYPFVDEAAYRDEVRRCREQHGLVALKVQPQYQGLNPLNPRHRFPFAIAQELGMALIWHTGAGVPFALPSLLMPVAREYPGLRIIAAHSGGGGMLVGEAIVAALFCPNIYLELSTLMPNHVMEILSHLPATRLMAGSDLLENVEVEMAKIERLAIGADQQREILGGTALRVFEDARA